MDGPLNESTAEEIRQYGAEYNNRPSNVVSFMTDIASTSGRLHGDFVRLLFLQVHRETDRFFAASGVQIAQSTSGQFHYLHTVFSSQFKSKVGNTFVKAAVSPDAGNHGPVPSRGGDAGLQHGSPWLTPIQDNRGSSRLRGHSGQWTGGIHERINPKERRSSAHSKRLTGGTESQGKHWPKDVTIVQIRMEHTVNDVQGRNGSRSTGTRGVTI